MPRIFFLLLLQVALALNCLAQANFKENKLPKNYCSALVERFETVDKERNKTFKEKELKGYFKELSEVVVYSVENNNYLMDTTFYLYLEGIKNKLLSQNNLGEYKEQFFVFAGRSPVPNAFCYGNQVLVINLGLISRLSNEDQLAFVLAHEMAHQLLEHSVKAFQHRNELENSREYKESIERIEDLSGARLDAIEEFRLSNMFATREQSRKHEMQADSMAYEFLLKAGYKVEESINLLAILDKIDVQKYPDTLHFRTLLSTPEVKFNPKWLLKSNGLAVEQKLDEKIVDSLKTHPDCKQRIQRLEDLFSLKKVPASSSESFVQLTEQADWYMLKSYYTKKRLAKCLTQSLELHQQFPEQQFLEGLAAVCLAELYLITKQHDLRKYTPRPDDEFSHNYEQVLWLTENIRLSELKKLSLSYMDQVLKDKGERGEEELLVYLELLKEKLNEAPDLEEKKIAFQKKYPKSIYHFNN